MFSKFDEAARKSLINSKKEMKELKHPYIGTEHFILAILNGKNKSIIDKFNKYGITYKKFKEMLIRIIGIGKKDTEWYIYTPLFKRIIEDSMIIARENNDEVILLEHILSSMFEEGEGVAIRIFMCMNVDIEKLEKEFIIKKGKKKIQGKKKLLVEDYGYNMNEKASKNEIDPVIGREKELERIIEILCRRTKNNPLLIGEAGVGKTAIIEELSKRIIEERVPQKLKNKKIISISMASLISGTKYRGEFEERIKKILTEIEENQDIILFIDEVHTLIGAGGAEGAIDASNILKPYLARDKLKLIGATTTHEYKKYLEDDHALDRRFQTVIIEETNEKETLEILTKIKPIYEEFHNVLISEEVLKAIVKYSNKYIYNRKQPDKAIDILDEACAKTSVSKNKKTQEIEKLKLELKSVKKKKNNAVTKQNFNEASILKKEENKLEEKIEKLEYNQYLFKSKKEVTEKAIAEIIKLKSNIPVYELSKDGLSDFKNKEASLNSKVIGQKQVISKIIKDIKQIKLGYKHDSKPRSYLFVGATGVGKTKLAKEIAKLFFGSNLIRLDMSEYKEAHSISKLIGSPPGYVGYSNKNTILDEIKLKPNSVILLDEIEKSHIDIVNLFLQALDEGKMKTSNNEVVNLENNIIIMTSNLGFKNNSLGFNDDKTDKIYRRLKETLGIEFINRIDKIFVFNALNAKDIKKIVLNNLNKMLETFSIMKSDFKINDTVINKIIEYSNYKEFGARKVEKVIKDKIYDIIIEEKIKKNDIITIETI